MKELLVVVDYQNDFVNGALGFEGAEKLDKPIAEKIKEYRSRGGDVIFTRDTHGENYLDIQEGRKLPVPHCINRSEGHALFGETAKQLLTGDIVIDKPSFGSLELAKTAIQRGYDRIELVGLVSNICVLTNAAVLKTALPEAEIIVDAACTSSFDRKLNTAALDCMEGIQINVINRGDK